MKNRKYISIAGILLAGLGLATSISNNVSAATETPLNTVLSVKYNGRGKVRLLNGAGKYQNQYVSNKQSFKVFAVATINGRTMYRLGSDKQWIPAEFTNLTPASTDSKANTASTTNAVTIKYVPGYGIAVWTSPNAGQSVIKGKVLKHNSSWKYFGTANGRDGYVWYNLGGNQWISSKYTNKPQQVATNSSNGSSAVIPSKGNQTNTTNTSNSNTKPSTPAQPSKPENNNSGNKPSNSGNSGSSTTKPVTPSKPTAEKFNKTLVEELVMQKINQLRTSQPSNGVYYGHGNLPAYKSNQELQNLAETRLNEIISSKNYSHTRPNGQSMGSMETYAKLLPNLNAAGRTGISGAAENIAVGSMGIGLTNESTANLVFDSWANANDGHRSNLISDFDHNAYAAVAVTELPNGEWLAVFEEAAID